LEGLSLSALHCSTEVSGGRLSTINGVFKATKRVFLTYCEDSGGVGQDSRSLVAVDTSLFDQSLWWQTTVGELGGWEELLEELKEKIEGKEGE